MSFSNPGQGISWTNQEVSIPELGITLTTIKSFNGGGWSVDAQAIYGAGKDPLSISEGNTTYGQITFDLQETEYLNVIEALGGPEAARSSGGKFTIVRAVSNNQQGAKYTYKECRFISAEPSFSQGPDVAMVACTIQPLSCQYGDTFNKNLVGTLLGKATDFIGNKVEDVLDSLF